MAALFFHTTIAETTLMLCDCRKIGSKHLVFYATAQECFDGYNGWEYALFCLFIAVMAFPTIIYMNTRRHRRAGRVSALAAPFREECWWWESLLVLRKLILLLLHMSPFELSERQALMSCACIAFLSLHLLYLPFKSKDANSCETTILFCLANISVLAILMEQVCTFFAHWMRMYTIIIV